MTLSQILPSIQSLPRADKLRLAELLAKDLAGEDDRAARQLPDQAVSIWSPYESFEGAAALLRALHEATATPATARQGDWQ